MGNDISEFIIDTKKMLDDIGIKIVQEALETVGLIVKQEKWRKEEWTIQRKEDK